MFSLFQDLFTSNWKSGVASVATKRLSSSGSQSGRSFLDRISNEI